MGAGASHRLVEDILVVRGVFPWRKKSIALTEGESACWSEHNIQPLRLAIMMGGTCIG